MNPPRNSASHACSTISIQRSALLETAEQNTPTMATFVVGTDDRWERSKFPVDPTIHTVILHITFFSDLLVARLGRCRSET